MDTIDALMHGAPGVTAVFLVQGRATALVEAGPSTSIDAVMEGLAARGVERLDWIVVTHIHLDHAGAAGALARRFPEAKVGVHPVGAPHLVDPAKLWSSAARIYGDKMEALWGSMEPIPQERVHILNDGDSIDLGGRTLTAVETPGHARHHHSLLDDATGTMFTGDALGVRLPDIAVTRPATPPPEFNLEDALASIQKIKERRPQQLALTHFGVQDVPVDEMCDSAAEALRRWAEYVTEARTRTKDLDAATELVRASVEEALPALTAAGVDRLERTTSYWMNTWGYMRYFDKKQQA